MAFTRHVCLGYRITATRQSYSYLSLPAPIIFTNVMMRMVQPISWPANLIKKMPHRVKSKNRFNRGTGYIALLPSLVKVTSILPDSSVANLGDGQRCSHALVVITARRHSIPSDLVATFLKLLATSVDLRNQGSLRGTLRIPGSV